MNWCVHGVSKEKANGGKKSKKKMRRFSLSSSIEMVIAFIRRASVCARASILADSTGQPYILYMLLLLLLYSSLLFSFCFVFFIILLLLPYEYLSIHPSPRLPAQSFPTLTSSWLFAILNCISCLQFVCAEPNIDFSHVHEFIVLTTQTNQIETISNSIIYSSAHIIFRHRRCRRRRSMPKTKT